MQQVSTKSTNVTLQTPSQSNPGLSSEEARRRLAAYGFNEPISSHRSAPILQFLRFFANPLVIILLIASVISAATGDKINSVIIIVIILLSVTLNFIQSARSQNAADQLRREMTLTATVLRDGAWSEIPRREVVPGDLIRLCAGDMTPADARLLESRICMCNRPRSPANLCRLKKSLFPGRNSREITL